MLQSTNNLPYHYAIQGIIFAINVSVTSIYLYLLLFTHFQHQLLQLLPLYFSLPLNHLANPLYLLDHLHRQDLDLHYKIPLIFLWHRWTQMQCHLLRPTIHLHFLFHPPFSWIPFSTSLSLLPLIFLLLEQHAMISVQAHDQSHLHCYVSWLPFRSWIHPRCSYYLYHCGLNFREDLLSWQ